MNVHPLGRSVHLAILNLDTNLDLTLSEQKILFRAKKNKNLLPQGAISAL